MSKSVEERIKFLQECANLYETGGNSHLTDAEYDKEYAELKAVKPNHPFFHDVGGIDDDHVYGTLVKHKYVMGSLSKDTNPEEFGVWFGKTYPNTDDVVAILDLKVDGLALCCKYQDGKLIQVVTRGDGITGVDVTLNALHVKGVEETIQAQGYVEVKGECYKNRQAFYSEGWDKGTADDKKVYANPRNFTAGSINQKDPNVTKERGLSFIAYEVRGVDFATEVDKVKFLIDNGFETLKQYVAKISCKGRTAKEVAGVVKKYMDRVDREGLPFDVDGVVFKLNDVAKAVAMGTRDDGKRPKANRAIKFPTDRQPTILKDIEWSIGRTGALTPVGLLEPVQLAGTTVQRVSLHNIAEMKRLGTLRYGCKVLVEKAGDIIPKVVEKLQDGNEPIKVPKRCPHCETELEWDDTKTTMWCRGDACPAQVNRSIEHWFKKLGVKGIGSGIIDKLTSSNINVDWDAWQPVECISDMYNVHLGEVALAPFFGKRAFQKIVEAIDSVKTVTLAQFIEALGIGQVGRTAKDIVAVASTVEDVDKLTLADLLKVEGFAKTKARAFLDGWKAQRDEITRLLEHITIEEAKPASDKLAGKSFCFTGSFSNPTRKEMEKQVEDNGGKKASVSKNLTALVWDGEMTGSKYDKAHKLGIDIIDQATFLRYLA